MSPGTAVLEVPQKVKEPSPEARTPLVAGNWKMHGTFVEAEELSRSILNCLIGRDDNVEYAICPPFTNLEIVGKILFCAKHDDKRRPPIVLGAQDVFWEKEGAFTGAISPVMLKRLDCVFCIIGHSERRKYFKETDQDINKKVQALLAIGITPIICVGESLEKRNEGAQQALDFILGQASLALHGLTPEKVAKCVIAYEPIWAIGTGRTATSEQAGEILRGIREWVSDMYDVPVAEKIRLLYGGSMKPDNAASFAALPDCDGGLIGGAALNAADFVAIGEPFAKR